MKIAEIKIDRDDVHKRLGGGIPWGSIILIEGEESTGKSIISQRLTYGFLQNNHSVVYISTQLTTTEYLKQTRSLNYDMNKKLLYGDILYIPVYPLLSHNIRRENFIDKIMSTKLFYEKDIIIFDTLSSLILNDVSDITTHDLVAFFKRIVGMNKIIIYTINPKELSESMLLLLRTAATVIFKTEIYSFGNNIKNMIKIEKYNLALGPFQKSIIYRVDPKIGIAVEISSIA
ncbi:ATPase domain-containing protein [Methanococcus aeolicus]|uniref:Flagella accessory protein H n=1 Tax=Methanococcus aeolicus (strain ATCC BAA-1280 / DSM 17508 / OCM 812 / Nankai-3) TaxID=419665 RepID=A6UTN3_META3|nr:ATPase domain-containing protein [Methanococcus aeolicus]ABR55855.1 flagella accessory protein H [Methanococcus aeolicus Nankai-3]UXM84039.1 flagellar accessory protein FlaH [Methanococcus aeolicus]